METTKTSKYKKDKTIDKYYQVGTGLVINSTEEKVVIGRLKNGQFVPLDQDDEIEQTLKLCEDNGLKFDETLVNFEEDEDTEQEVKSVPEETKPEESAPKESVNSSTDTSMVELAQMLQQHNEQLRSFVTRIMAKNSSSSETEKELAVAKQNLVDTRKELDALKAKLKSLF